nr:hypothetical protein [Tanacetum cinerariifolium]
MELKNILIEKMESNKSIHRFDDERNLYKALVEAYESDKIILDTYGDTVTLKRRCDDANKDEEPFAGLDRRSKRRREGKEPKSTSALTEKVTKTTGKSTQGAKRPQASATDDQPIAKVSQHLEWFQIQKKPPTPDRAWNKTLPATHGSIQLWIINLAKQADSRSSFNELMDTPNHHCHRTLDYRVAQLQASGLYHGKLTNLTVEECFAFNVSLRMFIRSIVIQWHVEDLQLGVESYQKKLNLTNSDTYRSDLKPKEAYTTYSNPRGFIYQNKDKQNRLMQFDELHKFSDGTLNDVRTALDDRLKEPEGSTQGYPLASVEVLRYDKRSKSKNIGIVPTEMKLILEHTQEGISHEVL